MIPIKTEQQIEMMRQAGAILALCHREISRRIGSGVSTMEMDRFVERFLAQHQATPEQKGYRGYPYATCASVNDIICHGFPNDKLLVSGDIVTIDMVVNYQGWLADSAWTYGIGRVSPLARKLMLATKEALMQGIEQAVPGKRIGDISHAVQSVARAKGYGIVTAFIGHGIGREMHEKPEVPNVGKRGTGVKLEPGMVITIEPIFTIGSPDIFVEADDWTARTMDGSWGAQYEHTVAITDKGPQILTK